MKTLLKALVALPLLAGSALSPAVVTPALAQDANDAVPDVSGTPEAIDGDALDEDVVSPVAEGREDCEAAADALRAKRDDNVLNSQDMRELRDKGC